MSTNTSSPKPRERIYSSFGLLEKHCPSLCPSLHRPFFTLVVMIELLKPCNDTFVELYLTRKQPSSPPYHPPFNFPAVMESYTRGPYLSYVSSPTIIFVFPPSIPPIKKKKIHKKEA
jgi:hypothetical protein